MWILVGLLGFSFPTDALLKAPEPRLASALHEMLLTKGFNTKLLYYIAPVLAFVVLYSILPHKVSIYGCVFDLCFSFESTVACV